ncbi:MAG: hypothetical protein M1833_002814 [Piccolia ochrophora]|nr:MAG: hypothetical protein M1833_002814 [Piccolia ochrophora]
MLLTSFIALLLLCASTLTSALLSKRASPAQYEIQCDGHLPPATSRQGKVNYPLPLTATHFRNVHELCVAGNPLVHNPLTNAQICPDPDPTGRACNAGCRCSPDGRVTCPAPPSVAWRRYPNDMPWYVNYMFRAACGERVERLSAGEKRGSWCRCVKKKALGRLSCFGGGCRGEGMVKEE